jgi:Plasmid pRiA4b ORF-3-like protein
LALLGEPGIRIVTSEYRLLESLLDEHSKKKYTLSTYKRNSKLRRAREVGSYRSRNIYQLHIQLEEIEPAIWRRISVPGKISLARLTHPHFFAEGFVSSLTHPPVSLNVTTSLK